MGPRNVYKDILNNMVSLVDHVVMNHQNQTRTNGISGHVHYSVVDFDIPEWEWVPIPSVVDDGINISALLF
jgi:hypothetical protein